MDSPTSQPKSRSTRSPTDAGAETFVPDGASRLELEAGETARGNSGYSLLIRGEVQASSILSSAKHDGSVTLMENKTKLVSGSLTGGTIGFVVDGTVVAAEFDDSAPAVTLDGAHVDPDRWPTVKEYIGFGPNGEPVEDPFPDGGELGAAPNDPLHPDEYVIELDASGIDEAKAYCFDIDGSVVNRADSSTVTDQEDRVYGCLQPGSSAAITIRGHVTRIEAADGLEFSIDAKHSA